ncbi:MAG: MoaD/ThiS family protein [Chloroflexota bacterium]|nr:MoaD/ThiS family protein [Chloroflexota bacterium]|tara:strand:- start:126 stop:395 length:270 start_codon:yes stop_codon:yes gene_type:complete
MAIVHIPSLMQSMTDGQQTVDVEGSNVRQVINNLDELHPGIKERLVANNKIKPNISVAVDGVVSSMGMLEKVQETSEVFFLPAIGGGAF